MTCQHCGGPMVPLGALGSLEHYRCRNCGAMDSQERDDFDVEVSLQRTDEDTPS